MRLWCSQLKLPVLVLAVTLVAAAPAEAQRRQSLSDRVTALEQKLATVGTDEDRKTLTDLVFRLGELEEELRQLRGRVENQGFELEELRQGSLDRYSELDRRLTELSQSLAADGAAMPQIADSTALGPADPVAPDDGSDDGGSAADPATTPVNSDPQTAGLAYDAAFQSLKDGRYDESARLFSQFLRDHPSSELADNAQYWLGESYYVTQNYKISRETFKGLLERFPQSDKIPDARLKLGFSQLALKQYPEAEQTLTAVSRDFPGTPVARLADARLRTMRIEGHIQ